MATTLSHYLGYPKPHCCYRSFFYFIYLYSSATGFRANKFVTFKLVRLSLVVTLAGEWSQCTGNLLLRSQRKYLASVHVLSSFWDCMKWDNRLFSFSANWPRSRSASGMPSVPQKFASMQAKTSLCWVYWMAEFIERTYLDRWSPHERRSEASQHFGRVREAGLWPYTNGALAESVDPIIAVAVCVKNNWSAHLGWMHMPSLNRHIASSENKKKKN